MQVLAKVQEGVFYGVSDVLAPYMWVFLFAWVISIIATPIMRHYALKNGIVDWPDLKRKKHPEPIAYLGGIAGQLWRTNASDLSFKTGTIVSGHNNQEAIGGICGRIRNSSRHISGSL